MQASSPDQESVGSGMTKRSYVSAGSRPQNRKEFFYKFVESERLTSELMDWFESLARKCTLKQHAFDVPFELIELKKFDYAFEGVSFQQLIRMPDVIHASTSDGVEATAYLAIEDFLHACVKGLWETFWSQDEPMPFSVACLYNCNMKFYQAEEAIANGKLQGLCATGIMLNNPRHPHGSWDHVLELALIRPDIGSLTAGDDHELFPSVLGEALFYALRMLLARSLSRLSFYHDLSTVFIVLVDPQYGGVVKVEGDVNKLNFDVNNVYKCAAEWVKNHSSIAVSPIDRIWNKLGNANWWDIGALQVLIATFLGMMQYAGPPRFSVEDLADVHSYHLLTRRAERQLYDDGVDENGLFQYHHCGVSTEIVEVQDDSVEAEFKAAMNLEVGSVLWLEDSDWQNGYQIREVFFTGEVTYYVASHFEDPGRNLFLYVGSCLSQLKPALEDMNLWYQVQRQTKVLTTMKQKGLASKYLPQVYASGRIKHPGHCRRSSLGGNCEHPWCGTPILVTSPVGETVAEMVSRGQFGSDEAIRCCHDCLSALSTAASAGIKHGDIRLENVIHVKSGVRHPYFVLIGWGHAILEDRDRPIMNLHFSSTNALQEGKLCSASDAESLIYMLYYSHAGAFPDLDSVEGALQWRQTSWSRRLIQQKLGDISSVLKAFADYVGSLCVTPYPMDYDIWLRRLSRNIYHEDRGKEIVAMG